MKMHFGFYLIIYFCLSVFNTRQSLAQSIKTKDQLNQKKQIYQIQSFTLIDWNGPITPATTEHIRHGISQVNQAGALIIELNTPGGLVSSMKDILQVIGEANVPVIVWINPVGASATSAGAFIAIGSHAVYMSQGSNIGAATPVSISGDIENNPNQQSTPNNQSTKQGLSTSDLRKKSINDLTALIQSLAIARGKNAEKYAEMVKEAASFDAQKAFQWNLIDGIADGRSDIERQLNNKTIMIQGKAYQLVIDRPSWNKVEMSLSSQLLNSLSHPNLAYILFLIGAALIYFELQAPGGFIAGTLGAFSLLLSGIGFQVLPLNFGALSLILLSFVFFILEVYITSFGLLTIAGIASLISGSLFLFHADDAYIQLSYSIIGSAIISISLFVVFVLFMIVKNRPVLKANSEQLTGYHALITKVFDQKEQLFWYHIKVNGEIWKACSEHQFSVNVQVQIDKKSRDGLYYSINKITHENIINKGEQI